MKLRHIVLAAAAALIGASSAQAAETITYTYDAQGRVIQVRSTGSASGPSTTTYTYDKAHNRVSATTVKS